MHLLARGVASLRTCAAGIHSSQPHPLLAEQVGVAVLRRHPHGCAGGSAPTACLSSHLSLPLPPIAASSRSLCGHPALLLMTPKAGRWQFSHACCRCPFGGYSLQPEALLRLQPA